LTWRGKLSSICWNWCRKSFRSAKTKKDAFYFVPNSTAEEKS